MMIWYSATRTTSTVFLFTFLILQFLTLEYGQQKLHESLQTLGAHIRRRLHGQLLETEPEEMDGVTFDIYNQPGSFFTLQSSLTPKHAPYFKAIDRAPASTQCSSLMLV